MRILILGAKLMRIRILDRLYSHKKLNFYAKNIHEVHDRSKKHLLKFCSILMLLDPDPHSQHVSGSKTAKSMWIHADPDPGQNLK
jgi:hypothetical protein